MFVSLFSLWLGCSAETPSQAEPPAQQKSTSPKNKPTLNEASNAAAADTPAVDVPEVLLKQIKPL